MCVKILKNGIKLAGYGWRSTGCPEFQHFQKRKSSCAYDVQVKTWRRYLENSNHKPIRMFSELSRKSIFDILVKTIGFDIFQHVWIELRREKKQRYFSKLDIDKSVNWTSAVETCSNEMFDLCFKRRRSCVHMSMNSIEVVITTIWTRMFSQKEEIQVHASTI